MNMLIGTKGRAIYERDRSWTQNNSHKRDKVRARARKRTTDRKEGDVYHRMENKKINELNAICAPHHTLTLSVYQRASYKVTSSSMHTVHRNRKFYMGMV